ncbi:MAG TPA: hypothetical protein VFQ39_01145 [Longimicrobium sp.]|nr:hypothetical protein [Longimicrobium sp.]
MEHREGVSPGVLIRDLIIFYIKLALDGLKGVVLVQVSIAAALVDLVFGGRRRGRFFYRVLNAAERFDLWLNLYGPSSRAGANPDGLFGESRAGDDTLLGEIEELVRRNPEAAARPASAIPTRPGLPGAR